MLKPETKDQLKKQRVAVTILTEDHGPGRAIFTNALYLAKLITDQEVIHIDWLDSK